MLGTAACLALSGCGDSVLHVQPPTPRNAVVTICAKLNDRLPNLLEHLQSRLTSPRSPLVHAWGEKHPVVLRCGVPEPAGYSPSSSQTAVVNGVSWFQQVQPHAVVWTAIRSGADIELVVPRSYEAQGAFLVSIGAAVAASIP